MENQKLFLTLHLHLHPHPHPHNALCFSGYNHFGIHNLIWPTRQYCEIDIITQTFKRNNWRLRKGTEAVQDHLCVEFRVSSDSMVAFPAPDGLYLIPSRLLTKMISFWAAASLRTHKTTLEEGGINKFIDPVNPRNPWRGPCMSPGLRHQFSDGWNAAHRGLWHVWSHGHGQEQSWDFTTCHRQLFRHCSLLLAF